MSTETQQLRDGLYRDRSGYLSRNEEGLDRQLTGEQAGKWCTGEGFWATELEDGFLQYYRELILPDEYLK